MKLVLWRLNGGCYIPYSGKDCGKSQLLRPLLLYRMSTDHCPQDETWDCVVRCITVCVGVVWVAADVVLTDDSSASAVLGRRCVVASSSTSRRSKHCWDGGIIMLSTAAAALLSLLSPSSVTSDDLQPHMLSVTTSLLVMFILRWSTLCKTTRHFLAKCRLICRLSSLPLNFSSSLVSELCMHPLSRQKPKL